MIINRKIVAALREVQSRNFWWSGLGYLHVTTGYVEALNKALLARVPLRATKSTSQPIDLLIPPDVVDLVRQNDLEVYAPVPGEMPPKAGRVIIGPVTLTLDPVSDSYPETDKIIDNARPVKGGRIAFSPRLLRSLANFALALDANALVLYPDDNDKATTDGVYFEAREGGDIVGMGVIMPIVPLLSGTEGQESQKDSLEELSIPADASGSLTTQPSP